jgi:hypothetical protein
MPSRPLPRSRQSRRAGGEIGDSNPCAGAHPTTHEKAMLPLGGDHRYRHRYRYRLSQTYTTDCDGDDDSDTDTDAFDFLLLFSEQSPFFAARISADWKRDREKSRPSPIWQSISIQRTTLPGSWSATSSTVTVHGTYSRAKIRHAFRYRPLDQRRSSTPMTIVAAVRGAPILK